MGKVATTYKVVIIKIYTRTPTPLDPGKLRSVVDHLFPRMATLSPANTAADGHGEADALVSSEEFLELPKLLMNGKPSMFRPIRLIEGTVKLLQKIVCVRLERAISDASQGHLSHSPSSDLGKRDPRLMLSTEWSKLRRRQMERGIKEYCLMVTLDTRNAFNTARCDWILDTLNGFGVPAYLTRLSTEGVFTHQVTGGVPQRSVLEPHLWNAMILRLPLACHRNIRIIEQWLSSMGFNLAPEKSEAVLISFRKVVETATVKIGSTSVASSRFIKYLGVMIDTRLSFREHLAYASTKAAGINRSLAAIMLNTRGPKQVSRRLLTSVTWATMLYAAPVWARALEVDSYAQGLTATHRLSALRIYSAFRTVSNEAALVIAGIPTLDIIAQENKSVFNQTHGRGLSSSAKRTVRAEARQRTMETWQHRWYHGVKGRWTQHLIPQAVDRTEPRPGDFPHNATDQRTRLLPQLSETLRLRVGGVSLV
uniref:GG12100 n=1 Tax=Drosophila erecta TaxID=7220 RepID=B3P254_DROER